MKAILSSRRHSKETSLDILFDETRKDERRICATAASFRMERLACHIQGEKLDCYQAAQLLREEAQRYENEAQELH